MAKKKSTKKPQTVQLTPKKYIETKCRQLPIEKCLIGHKAGFVSAIIVRKMPSGNFIIGTYLLDIFCLGLKDTDFRFNVNAVEAQEYINMYETTLGGLKLTNYVEVHNYIFGAIGYAEDLGFKPNKGFALTQYILDEDDDAIEFIEYKFGRDGKPLYMPGPYDDRNKIVATLKRTVGIGNYDILFPDGTYGSDFNDRDFDDDDFDDDFDFDDFADDDDFDDDDDAEDIDFEVVEDKK